MDKIKIIRVADRSPQWHLERNKRMQASDVSVFLNLNEYKAANRGFYEKIGMVEGSVEDNHKMRWGRALEDLIAKAWTFWDGSDCLPNEASGTVMRECRRLNGIITNDKYPWLGGNIDRLINKNQFAITADGTRGEINKDYGVLEIKTISGYASAKWESGIPPAYAIQVHVYMLLLGLDYGEIVILKDGSDFSVLPVYRSQVLIDMILDKSHDVWYNQILPGRQLFARYQLATDQNEKEDLLSQIHSLEPEPDGSEDYKKFMSEFYNTDHITIPGDSDDKSNALNCRVAYEIMKTAEKEKVYYEELLIQKIVHGGAEFLDLEELGRVRYYLKEGGKNKQLTPITNLKFKPEAERVVKGVQDMINKM